MSYELLINHVNDSTIKVNNQNVNDDKEDDVLDAQHTMTKSSSQFDLIKHQTSLFE